MQHLFLILVLDPYFISLKYKLPFSFYKVDNNNLRLMLEVQLSLLNRESILLVDNNPYIYYVTSW